MKKIALSIVVIGILTSCSDIMKEKVSTEGYESYLKILRQVDTIDSRERDFILEQSKEMIYPLAELESKHKEIGLKVDTSELPTYGEFYKIKSEFWRSMNKVQKKLMSQNLILDTAKVKITILNAEVNFGYIKKKERVELRNNFNNDCLWNIVYTLNIKGRAIIEHNLPELISFQPVNLDFLYFPTYVKINDSLYEFDYTYNVYDLYLDKWCYDDYLYNSMIEKDNQTRDKISKIQNDFNNIKGMKFRLEEVSMYSDIPNSKERVNPLYLTEAEYNEYKSIYDNDKTSNNAEMLKVKYGLNAKN